MGLGGSGDFRTGSSIFRVHALALGAAFGPGSCRNLVVRGGWHRLRTAGLEAGGGASDFVPGFRGERRSGMERRLLAHGAAELDHSGCASGFGCLCC